MSKEVSNTINVSITNTSINSLKTNCMHAGCGDNDSKKRKLHEIKNKSIPIKQLRQPISNLIETKKYLQIYSKVCSETILILQCCGFPGSGKSQIVRKLAAKFPFTEDNIDDTKEQTIIWHIQCRDSGHNILQQFKELVKKLHTNASIIETIECDSIIESLENGCTHSLVEILLKSDLNILILIEDPVNRDCTSLLKDFFRNVEKNYKYRRHRKFHLYITSRTTSSIETDETKQMQCFRNEIIKGFSVDEGVKCLLKEFFDQDEEGAKKVHQRFSGLPIALLPARSYCQNSKMSYSEYLLELKNNKDEMIIEDEDTIIEEYGKSAREIFQAIVTPFIPTSKKRVLKDKDLHYKILLCISYFNHDRIPKDAIECCCRLLERSQNKSFSMKSSNIKSKVELLISKLEKFYMCSITKENAVTFHEVIIHSFRLSRADPEIFIPLKIVVEVMAGLISKDMRKNDQKKKMLRMRRHLETVLDHVEKLEDELMLKAPVEESTLDYEEKCKNKLMLKALLSHLYETTAAIMHYESSGLFFQQADTYYQKALELILTEEDLIEEIQKKGLVDECFSVEVAKSVIEFSKIQSKLLPQSFTVEYASKLNISFDEEEMKFLKSRSNSKAGFENFKKNWDKNLPNKTLIENLQSCGLFLSNEKYRSIFYAERVASILHSWSRLIINAELDQAQTFERFRLMSKLSNSICLQCSNTCNVSLLMERLSITGGFIPIVLKQKNNQNDDYKKVLEICNRDLSIATDQKCMYENGFLKEVYGPSNDSTRITILKSIVRVNARLLDPNEKLDKKKADEQCKELFDLATEFHSELSNCLMCIIYCAKYYAAKRNVEKCMECFDEYFKRADDKFDKVYCWGVYNYLRAVSRFEASNERKDEANAKAKKILELKERFCSSDLREKISSLLSQLHKKPKTD